MPRRYLRDNILTSEPINKLAPQTELFYRRLMSEVDDYGLSDGRPAILRVSCFQLQLDRVREADIGRWISECTAVKPAVLVLFEAAGKPYLWMPKTGFLKRSRPKYPYPDKSFIETAFPELKDAWDEDFAQLRAACAQVQTNAPEYRDSSVEVRDSANTPPAPKGARKGKSRGSKPSGRLGPLHEAAFGNGAGHE